MLFGLCLTLGVVVLSVALRSYQSSFAQKTGAIGILAATFLGVYFATGSWVFGLIATVSWLFLPWLEILTRIRALRLPREKALRPKTRRRKFFPRSKTSRARSRTKDSRTSMMRVGTGKITASFSGSFTRKKIGRRRRFV